MLVIVEIALTIVVFVRGWKFWALLPPIIGLGLAFLIGFGIWMADLEMTDEEFSKFDPYFLIMDAIVILTLIGMAVRGRKKQTDFPQY